MQQMEAMNYCHIEYAIYLFETLHGLVIFGTL
jgi:hypothetical protein